MCSTPSNYTETKEKKQPLAFVVDEGVLDGTYPTEELKVEVKTLLQRMEKTLVAYSGAHLYVDITDDVKNHTKDTRAALSSYFLDGEE